MRKLLLATCLGAVATFVAGAANANDILLGVDECYLKVAHRDTLVAHLAGHLFAFKNMLRIH